MHVPPSSDVRLCAVSKDIMCGASWERGREREAVPNPSTVGCCIVPAVWQAGATVGAVGPTDVVLEDATLVRIMCCRSCHACGRGGGRAEDGGWRFFIPAPNPLAVQAVL
jgi:hypothetical protein